MIAYPRWPILLLLIFPLLGSGGCVTAVMWSDATDTMLSSDGIRGVVDAGDGSAAQLVVEYHSVGDFNLTQPENYYFLVPLGADGLPGAPFVYRGKAHSLHDIGCEVGQANRDETPQERKRLRGKRADLARLQPAGARPPTELAGFRAFARQDAQGRTRYLSLTSNDVSVTGFRVDPTGRLQPVDPEWKHAPVSDGVWPDGCVFIVLPYQQQRTPGQVTKSCLGAAVLTPFTLCFDVVTVPYVVLMVATGHGC